MNLEAVAPTLRPFGLNVTPQDLGDMLASQKREWAAKWARLADRMRENGFEPDKGDLLFVPSNCVWLHQPAWVRVSHLYDGMVMMRKPAALGLGSPQ